MTRAPIAKSVILRGSAFALAFGTAFLATSPVFAQQAYKEPFDRPLAVVSPNYVTLVLSVDVKRPAAAVWDQIGKFCSIRDWMQVSCEIAKGDDVTLGAVRIVRGKVIEMMIARTPTSYTYTQPVRVDWPFNAYHATLEVRPLGKKTSKLFYSFFYDNSMLASDAARTEEIANRKQRMGKMLQNMKILAEGGTLPPIP